MPPRYTYVWEFQVAPEHVATFIHHYGPDGRWSELFRRAPGYIETLLLEDPSMPGRYVTVDRWENAVAFQSFRARYGDAYAELDRLCEALTVDERSFGTFREVAPDEAS
ncbi:MAG: antibiotic biosynthesis monooxygenase family protein [Woeseiaceae bacterium]